MKKIKEIRLSNGISQSQLADAAEIPVGTIRKFESGERDINKASALAVYKIAEALNVKIEDLLEI